MWVKDRRQTTGCTATVKYHFRLQRRLSWINAQHACR
jgi:hypothetical protein